MPRVGMVHVEYANIAGEVEKPNTTKNLKKSQSLISPAIM